MKTKGTFLINRMEGYAQQIVELYDTADKRAKFAHTTARNLIKQLKIYSLLLQNIDGELPKNFSQRIEEIVSEISLTQQSITAELDTKEEVITQ